MRKLLAEAAQRAASYLESLPGRDVGSRPGAIERLAEALDGPLPSGPSSPAEVLAFLDDYGSPATVASAGGRYRSEEHTSELQSLMRTSYAVFCLKKKKIK